MLAEQPREQAPAVERHSGAPAGHLHPRALSKAERQKVTELLNSDEFVDAAPREVWATLADRGVYHCSVSTMYRLLGEHGEVRERRRQLQRPHYSKPELLATAPNEVWSWDITKLKGPAKWTYYYLYVILDIFSRYVVGWQVAPAESADLTERLILSTCLREGVQRDQLTIHADRGSAMTSKPVVQLLADLGVVRTHSRPHVSNDNPYSEAQFKTLKYRPDFPREFGSIQDARVFCQGFFDWYNHEHHHSGIALLTPATVHSGQAEAVVAKRQAILEGAFREHPDRFVRRAPRHPEVPRAAWINPPRQKPGNAETPAPSAG